MGYVDTSRCPPDAPLEVAIVGERRKARILRAPPWDPGGDRMRS
jgi:glycine cleavage system aminomethyltransferase T